MKLPNISRFITELPQERQLFYLKVFSVSFVSGFLMVAILLKSAMLFGSLGELKLVDHKRDQIIAQRQYWEDVLTRHGGYRDAYFQLAVLSYQLGEKNEAKDYLNEALALDPNFNKGYEFAEQVGLK